MKASQKFFFPPAFTAGLIFACLLFVSCSSEFSGLRPGNRGGGLGSIHPTHVGGGEVGVASKGFYPWEIWAAEANISDQAPGEVLNDPFIVKGDQLVKEGQRQEALGYYLKAKSPRLSFPVKQALVARIASTQLALDQAKESLLTLSQFFRDNSLHVSNVEAQSAIIFAYAYGRAGDIDQSLAWFSKLYGIFNGKGALSQSAAMGMTLLLRTIDDSGLVNLSSVWSSDPFVSTIIGQERSRRSRLGGAYEVTDRHKPFWSVLAPGTALDSQISSRKIDLNGDRRVTIGALLPLSGRYSNLGQSTLRGIEIALIESGIKIVAKDDLGDPSAITSSLDSMLSEANPTIILGPLLSDTAAVTVPILSERRIPQLSFSRKELPSYGGSSFQLGASTASQIESLLNITSGKLGIKRYAIVYYQDSNGYDFLREFRRFAAEMGLDLFYEFPYGDDYRQSFVSVAEELEKSDVQAIFFPDDIDKATVLLSNFTPFFKRKVRILGSAAWDNLQKISSSRTILEGALFVSPFFNKSERELIVRFKEIFQKQYGVTPDFLAAQGFDAATLALAAITREQNDGTPFLTGFKAIENYKGLTGQISILANGYFRRLFSVVELSEKGLKEHEP